ncbi:MAG: S8 family serine peptidase [Bacteroidia bacterium]|nr:S8 family serine peptidase [Bacteroidia bacterium]
MPVSLSADSSTVVLTFSAPVYAAQALVAGHPLCLAYQAVQREPCTRLVVWLAPHTYTDALVLAQQIVQPSVSVVDAAWGWQLPGGMVVWPSAQVVWQPAVAPDQTLLAQIQQQYGVQASGRTRTGIYWMRTGSVAKGLPLALALQTSGLATWSHPDFIAQPQRATDPLFPQQFYLQNTGQSIDGVAGQPGIDISVVPAWGMSTGSPGITVAVTDEGVEAHQDLEDAWGGSRVLPGYSVTDTVNGTGAPAASDESHGQACAGLIAASHDSLGTRGVAPGVYILPVYFPFTYLTPVSDLASAVAWAWQQGADVISNSWVYPVCLPNAFPVLTQSINDATLYGRGGLGCVVIHAAGNDGMNCVGFPANLPNTLSMGAVTSAGQLTSYSNHGTNLDLVAPSSGSFSMVRTLDRMGTNGYNVNGQYDLADINYTRNFGGTSTATALGAGGAALILSLFPYLNEYSVRDLLTSTATDLGSPGQDDSTGHGLLNIMGALQQAQAIYYLPVTWREVRAVPVATGIAVMWTTSAEAAVDYFIVEKRVGDRFVAVADIPAEGGLGQGGTYHWLDQRPAPGETIYRIQAIDLDGFSQYAPVVSAVYSRFSEVPRVQYAAGRLYIWWQTTSHHARIRLLALTGQICLDQPLQDRQELILPQGLAPGWYLLQLQDETGTHQHAICIDAP